MRIFPTSPGQWRKPEPAEHRSHVPCPAEEFPKHWGQVVDQAFQNKASRVVGIHTRSAETLGELAFNEIHWYTEVLPPSGDRH